jgi:transcriptional regulator with PAS, ATPase and Fis domain
MGARFRQREGPMKSPIISQGISDNSSLPEAYLDATMIGGSSAMREIKAYILRIATTDCTVLITGETGTGKELAAEAIHRNSPRRQRPFVCINCAALPDSLLESELFGYERGAFTGAYSSYAGKLKLAEGGTVFFDEIGDMTQYAQAKILRAIEGKEVYRLGGKKGISIDVRVIAATNQDPERLVADRILREDLYHRLNVARVHLPPLRERKEEILPLLNHYTRVLNRRYGSEVIGLTEEALDSLLKYNWPGNVRELKNLLEAAFINLPSRKISFMDLPKMFQKKFKELEGLPQVERDSVLSALFACNWNKSKAAQKLHWSRMTLYRKMAKHQILTSSKP